MLLAFSLSFAARGVSLSFNLDRSNTNITPNYSETIAALQKRQGGKGL